MHDIMCRRHPPNLPGGAATSKADQRSAPAGVPPYLHAPVRVHDDAASHAAATAHGAYAYTLGSDIYLGPDLGQPGTPSRAAVLRHETVHALQTQQPGSPAAEDAVEQQAHTWDGSQPLLAADPAQPHPWLWIPIIAGLYVLLRPNVANAPKPGDRTYPSVSPLQVAAEAFMLFGVPGGVGIRLARAGWTVVGVSAAEGAIASVGYRAVQDVAAGEFSGVQAYVVDATTGAVVGVVIGGVFQAWRGGKPGTTGGRNPDPLYHHTNAADAIESSGHVRGYTEGRVYTTPAPEISGTGQRLATGVGSPTGQRVAFTGEAAGMFEPHPAEGLFSWYKRRGGQYVSRRIGYNLAFDASSAARQGNTLTISRAAWQRQTGARWLWSHARLWGRRLLVDWGPFAAAGAYNIGSGAAYSRYPTPAAGTAGSAGSATGGASPTSSMPTGGSAAPLLPPLGAPDAGAGLDFAPLLDLQSAGALDAGMPFSPLLPAGDEADAGPLTLSPFLPGEEAQGTGGAGGETRQVQIIYVEHYDMASENSVATQGYNAECPSCHTRANQAQQSNLSQSLNFTFLEGGSRRTLPNFLNSGSGQMDADQRAALAAYVRMLQEEQ